MQFFPDRKRVTRLPGLAQTTIGWLSSSENCSVSVSRRGGGGGERDSRPFPSVGMLASRLGPPTFLGWQRFFSSLSEAREALAHVSEGEKKTKGLDRNRVSLILLPTSPRCDTGRNSEAELRHRQPGGCRGGPPSVVRHALPHRAADRPPWLVHRAQEHPRPRQGCRGTARQQPHSVSKRVHPVLNLMFFLVNSFQRRGISINGNSITQL